MNIGAKEQGFGKGVEARVVVLAWNKVSPPLGYVYC